MSTTYHFRIGTFSGDRQVTGGAIACEDGWWSDTWSQTMQMGASRFGSGSGSWNVTLVSGRSVAIWDDEDNSRLLMTLCQVPIGLSPGDSGGVLLHEAVDGIHGSIIEWRYTGST